MHEKISTRIRPIGALRSSKLLRFVSAISSSLYVFIQVMDEFTKNIKKNHDECGLLITMF